MCAEIIIIIFHETTWYRCHHHRHHHFHCRCHSCTSTRAHMKSSLIQWRRIFVYFAIFVSNHKDTSFHSIPWFCAWNVFDLHRAHTINICIFTQGSSSKNFRFHNSQYKAINIFSVLYCVAFFLSAFVSVFSAVASIHHRIPVFFLIFPAITLNRLSG